MSAVQDEYNLQYLAEHNDGYINIIHHDPDLTLTGF